MSVIVCRYTNMGGDSGFVGKCVQMDQICGQGYREYFHPAHIYRQMPYLPHMAESVLCVVF